MAEKKIGTKAFPHVFVILFCMMIVALIATYLVPSGEYTRVAGANGRMMVDPNSFTFLDKEFVNPLLVLTAIPQGLISSALIIFTIFIIGGSWEIIHATGTVTATVKKISSKMAGREMLIFPLLMIVFTIIVSLVGALELSLVFLPAIMPLMLALGFDTLTAAGVVLIGACAGFATSLTNPFTVGIAHQIAELPPYSGMGLRLAAQVVFFAIGVIYVIRYAKMIKADPTRSLVYQESKLFKESQADEEDIKFETKHALVALVFVIGLAIIMYGVLKLGWFMSEIGGVFLGMGFLAAIIGRVSPNTVCTVFVKGCVNVMGAALVVGLARGILVIIEAGAIIDTIVYGLVALLRFLPESITVVGVFIMQSLFNFIVGSGSGKTLITMPILTPLADLLDVTRQTFVFATVMGDGITNILYPTSGILMACIGFAKIPFQKWVKFIMPLILMWSGAAIVFLLYAQMTGYGPF